MLADVIGILWGALQDVISSQCDLTEQCLHCLQVVKDVLALNAIARHLKAGRASNGALRLDNTKLYFKMDDNGNPVSAEPYGEQRSPI